MTAFTLFLGNYLQKRGYKRTSFWIFYHTMVSHAKLQLCYNLIIVPYPVGWPQQLWDCDVLYNTPLLSFLSRLLSSLPLLYVYADDVSKHSSLPPQLLSPLSRVTSLPFLLGKDTKPGLRALKIQVCLGWPSS